MPDATKSTLEELSERYLHVRGHTLSTAGLEGFDQLKAEARYVLGEALELVDAIDALAELWSTSDADERSELLRDVRGEIADVTLSDTFLAGMLNFRYMPGGERLGPLTVESCIEEKTQSDQGRG